MTPGEYAAAVAGEVRAGMARKKKKQLDLAEVLNITTATAARRLNGTVPFDVVELMVVANWLDVPVESLQPPAKAGAA